MGCDYLEMPEILSLLERTIHSCAVLALEQYVRDRMTMFPLVELEYFFYRVKVRKEQLSIGDTDTVNLDRSPHLILFNLN